MHVFVTDSFFIAAPQLWPVGGGADDHQPPPSHVVDVVDVE